MITALLSHRGLQDLLFSSPGLDSHKPSLWGSIVFYIGAYFYFSFY
jgi:hypothetical protein